MKGYIIFALIIVCMALRGNLVLNGGGEKPDSVMQEFIRLSGGRHRHILVVTTASEDPTAPEYYIKLFRERYSCTNVTHLNITTREHAQSPRYVQMVNHAGGLWFSGGDQVRIINAFLNTPVGKAIVFAYERNGFCIGGTSAGTACQSRVMITGKGDLKVIKRKNIETIDGMGFLKDVIIDQHFVERQRQNRLISVVLENPGKIGVGVGEDTAVIYRNDDTFDVLGGGWVQVYDNRNVRVNTGLNDMIGGWGFKMHVLLPGDSFNMTSMSPYRRIL
jgi:cyanophycinase